METEGPDARSEESLDMDMYVAQLRSDPRELSSLYEDLLIGVNRFFRDDAAFEALNIASSPSWSSALRPAIRSASGCLAAQPGRRPIPSPSCSTSS